MTIPSGPRFLLAAALACVMVLSGCQSPAREGSVPLSEYALMRDREGLRLLAPSGCTAPENPLVVEGQIQTQLTQSSIAGRIGQYVMNIKGNVSSQHQCWIENGDLVFYEARIGDVTTARGLATIRSDRAEALDHTDLATVAAGNTLLEQYLTWRETAGPLGQDLGSPMVREVRAWLERIRTDGREPVENRAIAAYAYYDTFLYLVRQSRDEALRAEYGPTLDDALRTAAELGHPIAMNELSIGLTMEVSGAISQIRNGRDADLAALSARLAKDGALLFRAAELGSLDARTTLWALENAGLELNGTEVRLATLPTRRQVENALNARMREAYSTTDILFSGAMGLPAGHLIRCDQSWCSFGGFGFYRFTYPSALSCQGDDGRAVCEVTFRLLQRMDIGALNNQMTDFANTLMSAVSRATPISASITLNRSGQHWALVGPIVTR